MSRAKGDDLRVRGLGLAARFSLAMSLALAVVMGVFGVLLFGTTRRMVDRSVEDAFQSATQVMAENVGEEKNYEQVGSTARASAEGRLKRFDVRFHSGSFDGEPGYLYVYDKFTLVTPARGVTAVREGLLGLFIAATLTVILVGAAVAYFVASKVSRPLVDIVEDVRQISRGNLDHRSRVRNAGGEVALLARSIDRMAASLSASQDAELELSVREREREVALEVREALLPESRPGVPGYHVSDLHVDCPEPGGDFHDYVEADGRVALLVCEVSGVGVPGALVGATARAYLKSELARGGDLAATLKIVNRQLARDVRRGMYATTICAVLDPVAHVATVACAGHKLPLVRYSADDANLRLVQPEGIALGFDKGAVFDRSLAIQRVPMAPGDRLVLTNTGPVRVVSAAGEELGEKAFYRTILRSAQADADPDTLLAQLRKSLEVHAGGQPLPADISIVVLARDA